MIREGWHATRGLHLDSKTRGLWFCTGPETPPLFFTLSFSGLLVKKSEWQHDMNALSAAAEAEVCIPISKGRLFHPSRLWKLLLSEPKTFGFHLCPVVCLFVCWLVGWFVSGIAHTDFHETWMGDWSRPRMYLPLPRFPLQIQIKGQIHKLGLGV